VHPSSSDPDLVRAARADVVLPGATLPEQHASSEHAVQFYHSDEFLVSELVSYIVLGLREGESVVVIATESHRNATLAQLALRGIGVEAAARSGALVMLDAGDTLREITRPDGVDPARFHAVIGGVMTEALQRSDRRRARAYGEMVDLLWRDGRPSIALVLEELWNELLSLHPFSLLCAYAMDSFRGASDAGGFDLVCRAHGHVIPTETYVQGGEQQRLAEIARLQQRAAALELEVERRRALETQLRDALVERETLLERERAARAEAEAANEAKSVFLATMSHELRTPLNAIAGYVDLLVSSVYGSITDVQRAPLERIRCSQRHLLAMINDVLNFATIEVGRVEYHPAAVPVSELFTHLLQITESLADARGISISFDSTECAVMADRDRTAQILLNLLSNAIKFTPHGGRVDVTSRCGQSTVEIIVRDTGCGIPEEQMGAIFEPFVQVGRRLSQPREGVGLGLAISRDLARGMGGDLRGESREGAGSAFTLVLPTA